MILQSTHVPQCSRP